MRFRRRCCCVYLDRQSSKYIYTAVCTNNRHSTSIRTARYNACKVVVRRRGDNSRSGAWQCRRLGSKQSSLRPAYCLTWVCCGPCGLGVCLDFEVSRCPSSRSTPPNRPSDLLPLLLLFFQFFNFLNRSAKTETHQRHPRLGCFLTRAKHALAMGARDKTHRLRACFSLPPLGWIPDAKSCALLT